MVANFTHAKSEIVYVVAYVRVLIYLLTFGVFIVDVYKQGGGTLNVFAFY
jgi:hypothetical protein